MLLDDGYFFCRKLFLVNLLFYLFFILFAVLIASFLGVICFTRLSNFIAWRELKKCGRALSEVAVFRTWFNASLILTLFLGGLASWIWTRKFSFGFVFVLATPVVFRLWVRYCDFRVKRSLETSALSFFNALLGLIQSGKGLSVALFDLTRSQNSPFSDKLKKHLKNYEEGRSFSVVLAQFRKNTALPVVGSYLLALEMAYAQGLQIAPLLESIIPALEAEQNYQKKIGDLRFQMISQACLSFVIPWGLAGALYFFNPELFHSLSVKGGTICIGLVALIIESIGVWVLWQITKFC